MKPLILKLRWPNWKRIPVAVCLGVAMFSGRLALTQPIDTLPTTTTLRTGLEARLRHNDAELKRLTGPLLDPEGVTRNLGSPSSRNPDRITLPFPLTEDETVTVVGDNGVLGFVLTGKWILEYAKLNKLVPQYEKTLAAYREQVDLQDQIQAEMTGAMTVKDQKIGVLQEMNTSYQKQAELYKKIADEQSPTWFESVLRKIAFPAGLAVGIIVGAQIAK